MWDVRVEGVYVHFANFPFLYPLKMLKNVWFSDVSRGYTYRKLVSNGLKKYFFQVNSKHLKLNHSFS